MAEFDNTGMSGYEDGSDKETGNELMNQPVLKKRKVYKTMFTSTLFK